MLSNKGSITDYPFVPCADDLRDGQRRRAYLLRLQYGPNSELERLRAEVSQQIAFVQEIEVALRLAEEVAKAALKELRILKTPGKRGERKDLENTKDAVLVRGVDWILRCAKEDQREAIARREAELPPLSPDANVLCGGEGMTKTEAVRRWLREREAVDPEGNLRSEDDLENIVANKLNDTLKRYRELKKRPRKQKPAMG